MTVTTIRQNHLNPILGIASAQDADAIPWPTADRDRYIVDALYQTWPDIGRRATGTVPTSQSSDVYTIPLVSGVAMRVSRIDVEQTVGGVTARVDKALNWRYYSDTQVRVEPLIATVSGIALRFFGWVPYLADASDIPLRLEPVIAMRAAALAYGAEAGQMGNYKRQQGLDQSRVVDYQTLVGLSAYWERRYFEQIQKDVAQLSYAPRRGRR
jgi:hypothetical protein